MPESDREARVRRFNYATSRYEKDLERDRAERSARLRVQWASIRRAHPELCDLPPAKTSTRSATTSTRKVGSAPWAVRELHSDGRYEWYRVSDGSESGARALAERLRKTSAGRLEALQMGNGKAGRMTTR